MFSLPLLQFRHLSQDTLLLPSFLPLLLYFPYDTCVWCQREHGRWDWSTTCIAGSKEKYAISGHIGQWQICQFHWRSEDGPEDCVIPFTSASSWLKYRVVEYLVKLCALLWQNRVLWCVGRHLLSTNSVLNKKEVMFKSYIRFAVLIVLWSYLVCSPWYKILLCWMFVYLKRKKFLALILMRKCIWKVPTTEKTFGQHDDKCPNSTSYLC